MSEENPNTQHNPYENPEEQSATVKPITDL